MCPCVVNVETDGETPFPPAGQSPRSILKSHRLPGPRSPTACWRGTSCFVFLSRQHWAPPFSIAPAIATPVHALHVPCVSKRMIRLPRHCGIYFDKEGVRAHRNKGQAPIEGDKPRMDRRDTSSTDTPIGTPPQFPRLKLPKARAPFSQAHASDQLLSHVRHAPCLRHSVHPTLTARPTPCRAIHQAHPRHRVQV